MLFRFDNEYYSLTIKYLMASTLSHWFTYVHNIAIMLPVKQC
jgi:hypothetical protein